VDLWKLRRKRESKTIKNEKKKGVFTLDFNIRNKANRHEGKRVRQEDLIHARQAGIGGSLFLFAG